MRCSAPLRAPLAPGRAGQGPRGPPPPDTYIERAGAPGEMGGAGSFDRPSWDEYFMLQAELAKLRSNCIARQVGAVIARDHRQLATGYNGTPPGTRNCHEGGCRRCQMRVAGRIESGQDLTRCLCNHAEANAIMHCAILGIEAGTKGAVLYTTLVPCLECTKMAVTIGIRRFVCLGEYPESDMGLIRDAGVDLCKMDAGRVSRWARRIVEGGNGAAGGAGDAQAAAAAAAAAAGGG